MPVNAVGCSRWRPPPSWLCRFHWWDTCWSLFERDATLPKQGSFRTNSTYPSQDSWAGWAFTYSEIVFLLLKQADDGWMGRHATWRTSPTVLVICLVELTDRVARWRKDEAESNSLGKLGSKIVSFKLLFWMKTSTWASAMAAEIDLAHFCGGLFFAEPRSLEIGLGMTTLLHATTLILR